MHRIGTILTCICMLGAASPVFAGVQQNFSGASGSPTVAEADQLALFSEANKQYQNENYSGAAEGYVRLILSGLRNGSMYYNLGNCYFKLGMLGKAILSYRLAEL